MKNFSVTITSASELISILKEAKCGGQYVTLTCEKPISLNKFPTDGSEKIRIADNFTPMVKFSVQYHFGADYERAMSKALGADYEKGEDKNTETLIKGVAKRYISTDNTCLIYIEENRKALGTFLNGNELTTDEIAYMKKYLPKHKESAPIKYRTIGVKNVRTLTINHNTYNVRIGQPQVSVEILNAAEETKVAAEAK